MKYFALFPALALVVSACATTPKSFYENPAKAGDTALCRAVLETKDPAFQKDAFAEVARRGITLEQCQNKVAMETAALVGMAAVATGVAVVAACSNGCGGGGYTAPGYSSTDYDCAGGRGDGPYYQYGKIWVGPYDPHNLDADGDGWGCEASDIAYGR